jgi:putative ABC transport system permease protein
VFDQQDSEKSSLTAVIDETMAKTYWPNGDAIGRRIKRGGAQSTSPWMTIVGVVRHVRYRTLEEPSRVQLYMPHAQTPASGMSLAIRTDMNPRSLANVVQREVMALDPDQPIYGIRSMEELTAASVLRRRLVMLLLSLFAGIALLLAAVGIYGVMSYWVLQRVHELGIRIALGASRLDVLRMVLGQSLQVVLVGVGIGLAGAIALTRVMETLLFNVAPRDSGTFIVISLVLVAVGLAATCLPAHRATSIDPARMLRQE